MDLFEKIDQFEKMAKQLLEEDNFDDNDVADPETVVEYTLQQLGRKKASIQERMLKLAHLQGVKR